MRRCAKIAKAVRKEAPARTEAFLDKWFAPEARKWLREAMKKY